MGFRRHPRPQPVYTMRVPWNEYKRINQADILCAINDVAIAWQAMCKFVVLVATRSVEMRNRVLEHNKTVNLLTESRQ